MRVANHPDVSSVGGESRCKVQNLISGKTLASSGTCSLAARSQDKGMSSTVHAHSWRDPGRRRPAGAMQLSLSISTADI